MALRRPALRKAVAECPGRAGRGTLVRSSPGRRAVWPGPTRKPSSGRLRSPPGPAHVTVASRARSTGTTSAAGEAVTMLPPTVPTFRIWCPPPTPAPAGAAPPHPVDLRPRQAERRPRHRTCPDDTPALDDRRRHRAPAVHQLLVHHRVTTGADLAELGEQARARGDGARGEPRQPLGRPGVSRPRPGQAPAP